MLFHIAVKQSSTQAYIDFIAIAIAGEVNCRERNFQGKSFPSTVEVSSAASFIALLLCMMLLVVQYDTRKPLRNTLNRDG